MPRRQRHRPSPSARAQPDAQGRGSTPTFPVVRTRRIRFRWAALILVPLVSLLILEGVLRLFGFGYSSHFFLKTYPPEGQQAIENQRFGWQYFGPALARNPWPFSIPVAKTPGTIRIFVLGESAAYGDPQPEFSMARMLEVLLRNRFSTARFEVVNTAMTAINSHVILRIARDCARLNGDIWVLYLGNNEVVGPFGAGTIFGPQTPSRTAIRTSLWLKASKTGQLLEAAWRLLRPNAVGPSEWGGMMMFVHHQVGLGDSRLARVYRNFEDNLSDILRLGMRQGVRLVVSTVVTNLRDCAPFASRHRDGLTAEALAQWDGFYQNAIAAQATNGFDKAIEWLSAAAQIDNQFADLHYRWGQCALALGQNSAAKPQFVQARDQDALRFRADSRINEAIRKWASDREKEGIFLADSENTLTAQSPHGLPGEELLYKHVHLKFEGNYQVARAMAEQVKKALAGAKSEGKESIGDWLTAEECAHRLGFSNWNRYEALATIRARVNDPPFTFQLNHVQQRDRLQRQLEQLRPSLGIDALRQALAAGKQACSDRPDDWVLAGNLGRLLSRWGDLPGAAAAWSQVAQTLPHYPQPHYERGRLLTRLRNYGEARSEFERVLAVDPANTQALDGIGRVLAEQGNPLAAIVYYGRALQLKPYACETLVNMGLVLDRVGNSEEARKRFQEALKHKTNDAATLRSLAKVCYAEGWLPQAAEHYAAALQMEPADATTEVELGLTLAGMGRVAEAASHYAEAVRFNPASEEAHFRLGFELGRQGKTPEATAHFAEAVKLRPTFLEARLNLAIALYKQGRLPEAQTQFQAVLGLNPANGTARQYLNAIQGHVRSSGGAVELESRGSQP